jgi:hypothetical protein
MDAATWILVIEIFSFDPRLRNEASRTRTLPENACLILAQEVRSEITIAYCYEDGTPDPGWPSRPYEPLPPMCADCGPLPGRKRV